ncbi:collagen-binding domain-containing protein [Anaerosporobacter sp.]|uniref:collagen-binding domain-containing protein n=1 Tax=Anaerosporobacter sp. TaxID=1872529 RepID=UPI00286F2DC2|nr:collagen-binding domain-containing protein [Anaerosporobacter sp.]
MDNNGYSDKAMASAGLPYEDIKWYDVAGQPFGAASKFNVIVFNNANNIIDVEGPVAIGGSFYSPRGLSVGFAGKDKKAVSYSPDLVRFLIGGSVSMAGPLVVIGHVVAGGGFNAAKGSTYLIGKSGMMDQIQDLEFLYQANGGSRYWEPSDTGDHYLVSSYDVPRFIPASRIRANITGFFNDARESIENYKKCIEDLVPNGIVVENNHEWILRGNNPLQNVFLIDLKPNGLINKGIRAEVPQGSTVIVRLRTGANAHLQYGVYGEREKANRTLYVFEDASNIYMEKSSDIWGSILAPQAMFHAHPTGGHVSGNAALGAFAVNADSGFEFHNFPFVGGVRCQTTPVPVVPAPVVPAPVVPAPAIPTPVIPAPVSPAQEEREMCPECPTCPAQRPCPVPEPCPKPEPCPTCPAAPPCPKSEPCPTCPAAPPCPKPEPCPTCPVPPPCPKPEPCPACPECPKPKPCPECPPCPVCPEQKPCPVCEECKIKSGVIMGCIKGCCCNNFHDWDVKLYERCNNMDVLLRCVKIRGCGFFEFKVPYEGVYILKVRLANNRCRTFRCRPMVTLNNVGVERFMME